MKRIRRSVVIFCVLFVCISCDQVTKNIANNSLYPNQTISYLGNTFVLQLAMNDGSFLGMGSNWPELFQLLFLKILPLLFLLTFFIILFRSEKLSFLSIISLSLILGGGSSNMFDRILNNGYVVDFMNMGFGSLRTGIFNFADIFIMIGASLVLIERLSHKENRRSNN